VLTRQFRLNTWTAIRSNRASGPATSPTLGWSVIVEQPTREGVRQRDPSCSDSSASPSCWRAHRDRMGLSSSLLINPILKLRSAPRVVASRQLDTRFDISTGDEFGELGTPSHNGRPPGESCRKT